MYGVDISHHQGLNIIDKLLKEKDVPEFVIIKATEGRTYVDPQFHNNAKEAMNNGLLIGAYHYARPENGNTPEQEALNFVKQVEPYIGICVLALDWEGDAITKSNQAWALAWLDAVFQMTGIRPLFYVSESHIKNGGFANIAARNYGLWVAKWSKTQYPSTGKWSIWAMWQTEGDPLDKDIFNGKRQQFLKYAEVDEKWKGNYNLENDTGTKSCGCTCCMED